MSHEERVVRRKEILIVDDQPVMAMLMRDLLRPSFRDCTILKAESVERAPRHRSELPFGARLLQRRNRPPPHRTTGTSLQIDWNARTSERSNMKVSAWIAGGWVKRLVATGLAAAVAMPAGAASTVNEPLADLNSVLNELRQGGYVIYFRHAATNQAVAGVAAADLARCETQRNLSAKGREEAARIGKAIKALGIPVGSVLASPFCRAQDTARLAFGRFTVSKDLYFAIGADASEMKQLTNALRQLLSTPPPPATNAVLVSHSANLREAAGIFAKPEGVAYVFRPLPNGEFEAIARILPEDWSGAVAR